MKNFIAQLKPNSTYHVYNRSIGKEKLFHNADNFSYFLKKYQKHISPITHTFCYCLLPNHFHFLIRCKGEEEIEQLFIENCKNITSLSEYKKETLLKKEKVLSSYMSQQFSHLFNGYSQAFNKQQNRSGSLFSRPFQRLEVSEENYLRKLVHYIHYNPVEANLCNDPSDWQWSSYNSILSGDSTFLNSNELINWFVDKDNFIYVHKSNNF